MDYKTFQADVSVKADNDRGELVAAVVSYGMKDADGDIILPDAIENGAPCVVGSFGHAIWQGGQAGIPLGVGHLEATPKHAVLHAKMWIDEIPEARSVFHAVKRLGEHKMAQFSIGFTTEDSGPGEYKGVRANLLRKITVAECSPVLRGAQPGTHLIDAKHQVNRGALGEHGDPYAHLPTELAEAMRKAGGTLARMAWRDREEMQRIKMRLIRHQVLTAEYEAIRDEMAAARYLWGI